MHGSPPRFPAVKNRKNFCAGLLYALTGAGFAIGAGNYKVGDAARMGPGWFPLWLGIILAAIGIAVLIGSVSAKAARESLPRMDVRAIAWILGSLIAFGIALPWLGLVVSLIGLVVISSLASHEFEWKGTLINAVFLTALSMAAFIFGLHLQIPVWPTFIGS
jgi:hypothetical protein